MNSTTRFTFFLFIIFSGILSYGTELTLHSVFKNENILIPSKIVISDNDLYILDRGDHTIKVFSKTSELQRKIGKKGEGPGEFLNPTDILVTQDSLFVLDKFKVDFFSKQDGKLQSSKKFMPASPNKFCADGQTLFLTSLSAGKDSKVIHKLLNEKDKNELSTVTSFRESAQVTNGMLDIYKNFGSITMWQGQIYYAPMISNTVYAYTTDGRESGMASIPITPVDLKEVKLKQTSKGFQVNLDKGVLVDLFTGEEGLYLLVYDNDGHSVIFLIDKADQKISKRFQTKETLISCTVSGNELWAIGMTDDIEILTYKIR